MKKSIIMLAMLLFLQSCQIDSSSREEHLKAAKKQKEAAMLNTQLGLGYLKQGDRTRAKKKLLLAVKQDPDSAEVYAAMAYFFERSGDLNHAENYYKLSMAKGHNGGAQLNNFGVFLCRQGKYKEAEPYFIKAVNDTNYINTAAAYENAGLCALEAKELKKARDYFKMALEQDPSRSASFIEMVKIERKLGDNQQALNDLLKYPDLANHPDLLEQAESIASAAGRQDIANTYRAKIFELNKKTDQTGVNNNDNSHNG